MPFKINHTIDYRTMYMQSIMMIQYNIVSDIASMLALPGTIRFSEKNTFKFKEKTIDGITIEEEGIFILSGDTKIEIAEEDEAFKDFIKDTNNLINLYEAAVKQIIENQK